MCQPIKVLESSSGAGWSLGNQSHSLLSKSPEFFYLSGLSGWRLSQLEFRLRKPSPHLGKILQGAQKARSGLSEGREVFVLDAFVNHRDVTVQ